MVEASDALLGALDETVRRARGSVLYRERLANVAIRRIEDLQALPLTTREDLQAAGVHGTRAVPLEQVCHYGESSGTTGASNSVWLTLNDFTKDADVLRALLPDVFAPGRVLLNRFPFMAAPAHLMQLLAQRGGGVAIPAGNINWDVPFHRALELIQRCGAQVLASMPMEPIVLGEIAKWRGIDPARDLSIDTLFLGGSPLPPSMQRRLSRLWGARVIELYGSTETMLLGTGCAQGTLHFTSELAYGEVLDITRDVPAPAGEKGRLVVTTLGVEGSPLVRLDTRDIVQPLPACACGDPRPGLIVYGRAGDTIELGGRSLYPYELIDAASDAADALDSLVFFVVILPDRALVRIEEGPHPTGEPAAAFARALPGVPFEIERAAPQDLLDVELLCRSPQVYKPVVLSDWRTANRKILTVVEGMIEWPRPDFQEGKRWFQRMVRTQLRRRRLNKEVARRGGR